VQRPARRNEPESLPPASRTRRACLLIFLILFVSYAYFVHHPKGWNENSRLALAAAISRGLTFRIDQYVDVEQTLPPPRGKPVKPYDTGDMARVPRKTANGKLVYYRYSDKAPGSSLLAALPYGLLYHVFGETRHAVLRYGCVLFAVCLPSAAFGVVMFLFLQQFRPGEMAWNAGLTLAYGLGTLAFPFSTLLLGHQLAAAAGFTAFYLLFRRAPSALRPEVAFWIGFLLALTVLFAYPAAIVLTVVGLYAIWTLRRRPMLVVFLVLGALPCLAFQALYNWTCFGSVFSTGYPYHVSYGSEMAKGFLGSHWPTWERFSGTLFMPRRGLLYEMPMLLLCIAGYWVWWRAGRRREELVVSAVVVGAFIAFNSSFKYWDGVGSLGVRHVIPALPFLVIAASFLPRRWRPVFAGLAIVSVVYMLAGTAAGPRAEPKVQDALFGFSFPLLSAGYGTGTLGSVLIRGVGWAPRLPDWAAWLPVLCALVPLVIVARVLGWRLERALGVRPWMGPARRAAFSAAIAVGVFSAMLLASRIPLAQRYYDLGQACAWANDKRGQGPPEMAIVCMEQAVRLNPRSAIAHYELGGLYNRLYGPERSLSEAIASAELDPRNWSMVARIHYFLGNTDAARRALMRYAEHIRQVTNGDDIRGAIEDMWRTLDDYDPDWAPLGWQRAAVKTPISLP